MSAKEKTQSDSRVESTHIVLGGDTNALNTLFGGKLVHWIDIAAAAAARRHSGGVAVTASIDSLQFVRPIKLGDIVVLRAVVNRSWRTSMEIGVLAECEPTDGGERFIAAKAYLTFVAIDAAGNSRVVPKMVPDGPEAEEGYFQAEERRERRLKSRNAG